MAGTWAVRRPVKAKSAELDLGNRTGRCCKIIKVIKGIGQRELGGRRGKDEGGGQSEQSVNRVAEKQSSPK